VTQPARRRFAGRNDQVSAARAFIKDVLDGCPQLDVAVLLTSELCTNAVQHSASGNGGMFEVTVYLGAASLRVEVRDDGSAVTPEPRSFDECSEDGRGLEIVACLASRWGQRGDEYGRCVYFELRFGDLDGAVGPGSQGLIP
jgi:anti-sigma regulatory factor (Ser/Thr protein kinase)